MAKVTIRPLPAGYRKVSERLWPNFPPIFDGPPTQADIELALALVAELDPMSRRWYRLFVERHKR
jgi:hypothetical protein